MKTTIELLKRISHDLPQYIDKIVYFLNEYLDAYEINTPLRISHFLAHAMHESSSFNKLEENLNYSAKRILEVWPSRFNNENALKAEHNPQFLANWVYKSRMGNGDIRSNDGWNYRGGRIS